jgi:hypothetical protein
LKTLTDPQSLSRTLIEVLAMMLARQKTAQDDLGQALLISLGNSGESLYTAAEEANTTFLTFESLTLSVIVRSFYPNLPGPNWFLGVLRTKAIAAS